MQQDVTIELLVISQSESRVGLLNQRIAELTVLDVQTFVVNSLTAARQALSSGRFSMIFLDYHLSENSADSALMYLLSEFPETPVVEMGDEYDVDIEEHLLDLGAQDYLPLAKITSVGLMRAVRRSLERHRMVKESEVLKENVQLLSRVKLVNEELRRRNEEIMQFYQTISHELKTPLTSVVSFVSILDDELAGPINLKQREFLNIIEKNCRQITTCVNDLLTIASMETAKYALNCAPLDLNQLISRVVKSIEPLANDARITLQAKLDRLPLVMGDDVRITEVLNNLLSNAIKFTQEQGSVTVEAQVLKRASGFVQVSVIDTGVGISEKHLRRIFDRLYQVDGSDVHQERGLGLGLHICQQIVKLHGGQISVSSQLGRGTRFDFTFPIAETEDGKSISS